MNSSQLVFSPSTRFFTIATAGHVDHGKTSLLRKLTGIDPDRLKEEKERQMTTDLGFAFLPLNSQMVLGFVDVPGHGKFLKNMLAGVGGIDLALLVVAVDEGPMPQTKQHVRILSLLGVRKAVVALSKTDLIQEPEQIELVQEETEALLNAHGIEALAFCPISSTTGSGFDELKTSLQEQLEKGINRSEEGNLLLPVDRIFSKSGFGTVITGTLVSGKITVGDQIFVEPGEMSARVRRLETHGQPVNEARPGQRVACNIVLKDGENKLSRGHVLTGRALSATRALIVSIYDRPRTLSQELSDRLSDQPIRLYHGTAEYQGYLRWVEDRELNAEAASKMQAGFGFIALNQDAVLAAQDKFVIRLTDDTIYGGTILLRERPRWLSKGEILELAAMLDEEKFAEALRTFLEDAPQTMLKEEQLSTILPDLTQSCVTKEAIAAKWLTKLGEYYLSVSSREELSKRLRSAVEELSKSVEDDHEGITIESTRQKLQPKIERAAFQALLEEETQAGRLLRQGDKLSLPGKQSSKESTAVGSQTEEKVKEILLAHWCLELDEIAQESGLELKSVKQAVNALTRSGELVVASYDFIASKEKIREAHQVLADLWNAKRSIAPTDFKEKIGVTRKYAMALLQYFDDAQITRRLESGRVLLKGPPKS